jgi:hypothetical protein
MVLIDDPEKTVIEPLFQKELKTVYDFDLMMCSGHVTGYSIDDEETIHAIAAKLARLADTEMFKKKYDVSDNHVLLYAMGDGNHSLATAKTIWETMKNEAKDKVAIMQHPARYTLVELVNVHDEGLEFAPIHRLAFDVNIHDLFDHMKSFYEKQGSQFAYTAVSTLQEPHQHSTAQPNTHIIPFVAQNMQGIISVHKPKLHLEVATLQSFLDDYMKGSKSAKIDYVHDKDVVAELGAKPNNIGFYLPAISKHIFFRTIIVDGALPSKTFSMGKADEKRFYLECRKITS